MQCRPRKKKEYENADNSSSDNFESEGWLLVLRVFFPLLSNLPNRLSLEVPLQLPLIEDAPPPLRYPIRPCLPKKGRPQDLRIDRLLVLTLKLQQCIGPIFCARTKRLFQRYPLLPLPGTHPSVEPSGPNVSSASSMEVNSDALPNLNAVAASLAMLTAKSLASAGPWILASRRNSHCRFQKVPRSPSRGRPSPRGRHMGGSRFDQTRFASRDKSGDRDWYVAFDGDLGESTGIEGESERILKSVGGSDISTVTRTAGRALARQLASEGVLMSHRDVRGRNPSLRPVEIGPSRALADPITMSVSSSKEVMGRVASIEKPKKLSTAHFSATTAD
ncbi:hypothetical protein Cni_G12722 [Canna indica]|uniref:Uncharacterized protein n=1 Tax=Canna indica TaxID=4628 RepID=A0AAQ3KE07_9LILI|nr:hypothetical protein Cni_G12722 [Canna indica]